MKIFLTSPYILKEDNVHGFIKNLFIEMGHDVFDGHSVMHLDEEQLVSVVTKEIESCDLIVADVSMPSHGVSFDAVCANIFDKPCLCLKRRDAKVSKVIHAISDVVEYNSLEDLREKIKNMDFSEIRVKRFLK